MKKTRKAYGYHTKKGILFCLGDTIKQALEANMTVKEYEKKLVETNPQLEITFKIEPRETTNELKHLEYYF